MIYLTLIPKYGWYGKGEASVLSDIYLKNNVCQKGHYDRAGLRDRMHRQNKGEDRIVLSTFTISALYLFHYLFLI